MRHRVKKDRLSRSLGLRKALLKSLLKSLIINEAIRTTTSKAKVLKVHMDRLISLSKKDTLAARRQVFDRIGDHSLVKKLFAEIGPRFSKIQGSGCRIYKVGFRSSDGASLSLIELTKKSDRKIDKKVKEKKKKKVKKEGAQETLKSKEEKPKEGKKEKASNQDLASKEKGVSGLKKMLRKRKKH